jgi:hypothetical protein
MRDHPSTRAAEAEKERSDHAALLKENATTWFFYFVAACLIGVGFCVAFLPTKVNPDQGRAALYLFSAAAGVMLAREFIYLLPKLNKGKVGGVELEFKSLAEAKEKIGRLEDDALVATQGVGTSAKQEAKRLAQEGGQE